MALGGGRSPEEVVERSRAFFESAGFDAEIEVRGAFAYFRGTLAPSGF